MPTDAIGSGLPWVDAIARSFETLSFVEFNRVRLPELVERHGPLVAADLSSAAPVAFGVGGAGSFTWTASADGMRVVPGDVEADTIVELSERTFLEFVQELLTKTGRV